MNVMSPSLVAVSGPLSGASFPLDQPETSVGCDRSNRIALADGTISPQHCVLTWQGQQIVVRDLDAGNPEELGGQYGDLLRRFPRINVLGGCCGTDHRHVGCISTACRGAVQAA